jgi:hypothetical protein
MGPYDYMDMYWQLRRAARGRGFPIQSVKYIMHFLDPFFTGFIILNTLFLSYYLNILITILLLFL